MFEQIEQINEKDQEKKIFNQIYKPHFDNLMFEIETWKMKVMVS